MTVFRVLLIFCMLVQPFCGHCFAEMRMMSQRLETAAGASDEEILTGDAGLFPEESQSVCTKKPCLSTPKVIPAPYQIAACVWHDVSITDMFSSGFIPTNNLTLSDADSLVWLRFSVLLI